MADNLQKITQKIISICQDEPTIVAAYIFGSYAKGTEKNQSDIDIALLLDNINFNNYPQLHFSTLFEKKLECSVDLVVLNTAGELLKYEIRRHRFLVFERSSQKRKQFEVRSRKYFDDFLFIHNKYVSKVLYGGVNGKQNSH